jgi:uncharacterized protein YndB with AHSA1/START domain
VTEAVSVDIRRTLPASIDEVFRWWTQPDLLERWMSPSGSVEAHVELRVGGTFHIVMKDAGVEIDHRGEYLEIDPPRRLVFTWESRYTAGASVVTVSLERDGDACTRLQIVHSRLPEDVASGHAGGWGAMADRLEKELNAS